MQKTLKRQPGLCSVSLFLLLLLAACVGNGEQMRMEQVLAEADSMNRAYTSMASSDSILTEATHYYDRHGTPNERTRAYYLLGCAYRDKGEAPQALECYQQAIDCADTTAADCNFRLLMSINGQMAELFHAQNLPTDEITCWKEYQRYARLAKDTIQYIRGIELLTKPYFLLGDTDRMIESIMESRRLYIEHGDSDLAVGSFGILIYLYLNRGQLDTAHHLMQEYECKSGLFDEKGEIVKERGVYNYLKGSYFIQIHQLDSAEHYIRKLFSCNLELDAYRGLSAIYKQKGNTDSIYKFTQNYENAVDSYKNNLRTETLHQMSSLYNYHRFQRKADSARIAAANTRIRFGLALMVTLFLLIFVLWQYARARKKRQEAQIKYEQKKNLLHQIEQELELLQMHEKENRTLIATKEEQIHCLEEEILSYERDRHGLLKSQENNLRNLEVYQNFHSMARKALIPSDEDWEKLYIGIKDVLPSFCDFIDCNKYQLNQTEYRTCFLIRIHLNVKDMSNMLGVSSAYISKIRKEMLKTLFDCSGSASDFDKKVLGLS